jgi:hypothetical protein
MHVITRISELSMQGYRGKLELLGWGRSKPIQIGGIGPPLHVKIANDVNCRWRMSKLACSFLALSGVRETHTTSLSSIVLAYIYR